MALSKRRDSSDDHISLDRTRRIARGEETNYIMATYGIYLSMFNIFISLLQILGIMGSDD